MTNEELLKKNQELERENLALRGIKTETISEVKTYSFSKIRDKELKKLVNIKKNLDESIFDEWLKNDIIVSEEVEDFFKKLLKQNRKLISTYNEDELKMYFIAPILNKVQFLSYQDEMRGFYETALNYETDKFIFNGNVDFVVAKGLVDCEKPYFFIQEFKRAEEFSNPRPQLLAEMISAVELNKTKSIRGAFITGENWKFVILEKLGKDKYQYFISESFNSTKIDELKGIYRNLQFVKDEIIEMVRQEKQISVRD